MIKNFTLLDFLKYISDCNGDEALEIITKFQLGAISIENINVRELLDED